VGKCIDVEPYRKQITLQIWCCFYVPRVEVRCYHSFGW